MRLEPLKRATVGCLELFLCLCAIGVPETWCKLISGLGSEDEVRLVEHLFAKQGYNPLIRPVRNLTEVIKVEFGLAYIQLINVDEKNQILKSNVWLRMAWHDYQLEWDPAEYGSISVIRIQPSKVWKPDIVLFNNADGKYEVSWEPNILIYSYGRVMWIPPAIYKSSAPIDVTYFPFDEQRCVMKFGSWTFHANQVSLDWYEGRQQVDLSDYMPSGTWDVIRCPGIKINYTDSANRDQVQIHWVITIRRKTLFYTVNLIVPCVLISFLSVCVFYLPADAGEKMTLCISILLALVVFLLLVSKILPPTSLVIPLISKFLLFTFIMNIFTIFITVIIINWNFRTPRTHKMPYWARVVFLNYLPKILLMRRPNHEQRWKPKPEVPKRPAHQTRGRMDSRPFNLNNRHDLMELSDMPNCRFNHIHDESGTDHSVRPTPEIYKAVEGIKFIYHHIKADDDYQTIREDWKYIAMVIDRLQLWIFLAVTISGTVGILINAPHIFEYVDQAKIVSDIQSKAAKS